ncbi:hypothetical protein B0H13DRAFT_2358674 [Mycena leptocephala]|nr:hypothetical protein B0H13DRAFT_2358674 [Mycena leptocephala]
MAQPFRAFKLITVLIVVAMCVCLVVALPSPSETHNITIPVPDGSIIYGDSTLCTPASPVDIIIFYIANYFAHVATIRSYPGESGIASYLRYLLALFFPASGLVRGLNALLRRGRFANGALYQAAHSGALCMVVRNNDWKPEDGFETTNIRLKLGSGFLGRVLAFKNFVPKGIMKSIGDNEWPDLTTTPTVLRAYIPPYARESGSAGSFEDTGDFYVDTRSRNVHGVHHLPPGYSFAHVPRDATLEPLASGVDLVLSANWNVTKALAALIQGVYSAYTLYHSQAGGQVQRYGYAAFGLTVLPYTTMTMVNLVANMLTPDYTTLYVVGSEILTEAGQRLDAGPVFHGLVGNLVSVNGTPPIDNGYQWGIDTPDPCEELWGKFHVATNGGIDITWAKSKSQPHTVPGTDGATSNPPDTELARLDGGDVSESVTKPPPLDVSTIQTLSQLPDSHISLQVPACAPFARSENTLPPSSILVINVTLVINAVIVLLLGYLSEWFNPGASTRAQRGWTMSWLAVGSLMGFYSAFSKGRPDAFHLFLPNRGFVNGAIICTYCVPAVGGLVVVGQMIHEYGSCIKI